MKTRILILILLFMVSSVFLPGVDREKLVGKYLRDLDESVDRETAMLWLGRFKEPRAIPYLVEIIEKEESDLLSRAIFCLGRIGHPDGIFPLIDYLLSGKDSDYDDNCYYALEQIYPEWMKREDVCAYIPQFLEAFDRMKSICPSDDYDFNAASRKAFLLKFIILVSPQQAVPFSFKLITQPDDSTVYIPEMILKNLVDYNVREAWEPILKQVFDFDSRMVPLPALIDALDKLHPGWKETEAFKFNLNAQLQKFEGKYREDELYQILEIVKAVKPFALVPVLERIVTNSEVVDRIKAKAFSELGKISPNDHFDLFVSGLKSTDMFVRSACIDGLVNSRDVKAAKYLVRLLRDSDEEIRIAAISALGKLKFRKSIRPLVNLTKNPTDIDLFVPVVIKALFSIEPGPPLDKIIQVCEKWRKKITIFERWDILKGFFEVSDPRAMNYLLRIYPAASEREKLQLLRFFIKKKDKRLLPIFREALKSSDIRIRAYAEAGIFKLSSD